MSEYENLRELERMVITHMTNPEQRMTGQVKRVIAQKGYGFILGQDQREYFFHADDLINTEFSLIVHEVEHSRPVHVTYKPTASEKGMRASNITLVTN